MALNTMSYLFSKKCLIPVSLIGFNLFSTTTVVCGANRVMHKLMKAPKKSKRMYPETATSQTPLQYTRGSSEGKKSTSSKRAMVLNKLLMRHITDLMATGENSSVFTGHGIEINRVKVTPDYQAVHVYWLAKGTHKDDYIDKILNSHAGHLRHELTQLRIVGVVPKIHFVKDKQFAQLMELDLRLVQADYGEDHQPSEYASKLKSQLELHTPLEPHIRDKIKELDSLVHTEEINEDVPKMPQNVLGLDHACIMEKVKKSVKKSTAPHRFIEESEDSAKLETFNIKPLEYPNMKAQREAFKEFLTKRQIMKSKAKKDVKELRPELDYLEEEWELKKNSQAVSDWEYAEEKDFIEDEEANEK